MKYVCFCADYQAQMISSIRRNLGIFICRRGGKTWVFRMRAPKRCLENKNFRYLYMCQINKSAEKLFKEVAYSPALKPFIASLSKRSPYTIFFKNGSYIEFWNYGDPDALRGNEYDEVWIDEIQDFPEEAYGNVIRPMVGPTGGTIVVSGQFRGEGCRFYREFYQAGQSPYLLDERGQPLISEVTGLPILNTENASWQISADKAITYQGEMGRRELARIKRQLTKNQYAVEMQCEAAASYAAVFDPEDLRRCIRGVIPEEPDRKRAYIIGLDLGEAHDHSVIVVYDVFSRLVVHCHQFELRTRPEQIAQYVATQAKLWNDADVVIDVTGQGGAAGGVDGNRRVQIISQAISGRVHHVVINGPSRKGDIVRNMEVEIANDRLSIPPEFRTLIREMQSFEFSQYGMHYQYHSPKSQSSIHDDCVVALGLCIWGAHPDRKWYDDPGRMKLVPTGI